MDSMGQGGSEGADGAAPSPEKENKRLKEEIAFLTKKLQLVGSVTRHDVLNQLTAIVGYNELLSMTIEDEKTKSFLEREKQAADKIRRLFQFAKDYQNLATEPPRWQNLANAVNRARETVDGLKVEIAGPAGTITVLADSHFDKALQYILENTVRHAGRPPVIRISLKDAGTHAELVLEDDGAGIPAKEKERIFERGYGKGVGWGLFVAREILGITGLTIVENGEPEKGVRFVITLPAGTYRENGEETVFPAV
jgi:signal transduction histidine kinase